MKKTKMDGNAPKTSYRQFEYCSFCRISHKKGKKHLYSTKHKMIIHNIIDKNKKKITEALETLPDPIIERLGGTDMNQKFWCHFCAEDVAKHQILDAGLLRFGNMLEHITSEEHKKKTANFFRVHRVDESIHNRTIHCLSKEKLQAYQILTVHAVRKFEERQNHQKYQIAKKLREQETRRRNISQWEGWKTARQHEFSDHPRGNTLPVPSTDPAFQTQGVSTLTARGDGMTFIGAQEFYEEEGNVHTGGMPPWLQEEEEEGDTGSGKEIGPTLQDYQKHLASEKKKKLPACRVGANFDQKSAASESWLPSFGQVWNSGRRLNSKKYFERETKKLTVLGKRDKTELLSSTYSSKGLTGSSSAGEISGYPRQHAIPYKRKRKLSPVTTNNGQSGMSQWSEMTSNNTDSTADGHQKMTSSHGHQTPPVTSDITVNTTNSSASSQSIFSRSYSHGVSKNILHYPTPQDYFNMNGNSSVVQQDKNYSCSNLHGHDTSYLSQGNSQDNNLEVEEKSGPSRHLNVLPYKRKRAPSFSEKCSPQTCQQVNTFNTGFTFLSTPVLENMKKKSK